MKNGAFNHHFSWKTKDATRRTTAPHALDARSRGDKLLRYEFRMLTSHSSVVVMMLAISGMTVGASSTESTINPRLSMNGETPRRINFEMSVSIEARSVESNSPTAITLVCAYL